MANITTDTNYSDVQQADNGNFNISEGAKLTISQSTADLRYIRCNGFGSCLIKNESTSTPIIVALGSTGSNPQFRFCLLYTSPSPRDVEESRMPSSA